jgi:hypothetical protein
VAKMKSDIFFNIVDKLSTVDNLKKHKRREWSEFLDFKTRLEIVAFKQRKLDLDKLGGPYSKYSKAP